jgi:putative chitinase
MTITSEQLLTIAGGKVTAARRSNADSVAVSIQTYGERFGLTKPHRLAHFVAQLAHESAGFKYDRELWGPTKAQVGYEGRKDLGNTQTGDGAKFSGKGPIQVTGRGNVTRFHKWCVDQGLNPPNFTNNPDSINMDPWEGLSAVWYWSVGNPTGKSLNVYADENNIMQITKRINGGLNGYDDRIRYYIRTALVLLGRTPTDVAGFQQWAQNRDFLPKDTPDMKQVDGDAGPRTLAALHNALASAGGNLNTTTSAPVVEEKEVTVEIPVEVPVDVPVVPEGSNKTGSTWLMGLIGILAPVISGFAELDLVSKLLIGGVGILAVGFLIWRGEVIAQRVRAVVAEFAK